MTGSTVTEPLSRTARQSMVLVLSTWVGFTSLLAVLIVLLPLRLEELNYGVDATAAVIGAAGIGGVFSAELVGRAVDRIGPVALLRTALISGAVCVALFGIVTAFVPLLILHAAMGVCAAAMRLCSQVIVRQSVPHDRRGRIHGMQGGVTRVAMLVGPILAGLMWDYLPASVSFGIPAALAGALILAAWSTTVAIDEAKPDAAPTATVRWSDLFTVSIGPILFKAARSGRMLLLPLIGIELELSSPLIGLLVGLSTGADLLVSPISGPLMDRRGRLASIIPSFSLMAVGFAVLALASSGWIVAAAAIILGVGNGLSAGLLLTLGSDLAPPGNEGPFLGRFGALGDIGRLVGPLLVGGLGRALGLNAAAATLAVVTVVALGVMVVFVGETRDRHPLPGITGAA